MKMQGYTLLKVTADQGAGKLGAAAGVEAILNVASGIPGSRLSSVRQFDLPWENAGETVEEKTPLARHIIPAIGYHEKVAATVRSVLEEQRFPLVLSGDHSSAAAVIAGLKAAFPQDTLGIIWIDAHADLHSPFTTPSGNLHGMPLAAVLGEDNKESAIHQPDALTLQGWEALKKVAGPSPKVKGTDIVFIGLRSTEAPEEHLIRKHGMTCITVDQVRKKGAAAITEIVRQALKNCSRIFVSFDVDCLDPSVSKGTGTPVDGGLMVDEARDLVDLLMKEPAVICLEVTEVNPLLEQDNKMAVVAYDVIDTALNSHANV